ncbi:RNA polymerase sigma factor SigV [Planctomycetaceae bacterium]|nr:RNA polymerase sigma factor SigV [Planctomycetaceae bacterium]
MSLALELSNPRVPIAAASHASLLARLRARQKAALEELALQFSQPLTRAAYVYLGDSDAAQDAAQDTLLAAWDGASRTSDETRLRPWLFGVLFNCCRKQLRSLARRRKREQRASRSEAQGAAAGIPDGDEHARLQIALAALPEDSRQVVVLRFEQQFSVEETAHALGIPQGTVKSRLHAALERLRAMLEPPHA